jgi:hypothetical protein
LHGLYPSSGKEKAFAESTLDLDNKGRKWFCEFVKVSQRLPERLRFGGLFLCLNDSWLIDRVRGSLFRAAPEHREDFAKADRQFQKRTDRAGLARFEPENRQALVVGIRRANTNVRGQEIADCI